MVAGSMIVSTGVCLAQVTTATFFGIVNDPTGAAIPGATVTLTHTDTRTSATKTTDSSGEFAFDFLRVGSYTLRIESQGFRAYQSTGILLAAGQMVRRTFGLQLGALAETVEVVGETPQLNTVAAEQRETLSTQQVTQLPLPQRSFEHLLNVAAGVQVAYNSSGEGGIRVNGLGKSGVKITVDGTDASSNPETPGTSMKQNFNVIHTMSIEAIQEVQVAKGVTPAEYGHQLSGNINVISKSGTNEWHGTVFENFRAEDLNATDRRLGRKTPFTFNQFGGSVGGPIRHSRVFIFGTYEGYREASFGLIQGDVPTQKVRQEAIQAVPIYKMFLDTLYLPNQPYAPDADTARYLGAGTQPEARRDNHAVVKGDVRPTNTSTLALTYVRSRPYRVSSQGRTQIGNYREWQGWSERGTASFVTAGAAWTSETRFGYNFNDVERVDGSWLFKLPDHPETTVGGRRMPCISVAGIFGSGGCSELINTFGPVWSIEEKYSRHVGEHSFKFGGIYSTRAPGRFDIQNTEFSYATKADFFANIPRTVTATFGNNAYTSDSFVFGLFAQDDWRIRPHLVINLGVRYDYFSKFVARPKNPKEPAGLFNPNGLLDNQFHFGPMRDPEDPFEDDRGANIGPRVGFSYNPDKQDKNVIRGGFSVMFMPQPWDDYNLAVSTSPTLPMRVTLSRNEALAMGVRFPSFNDDLRPLVQGRGGVQFGYAFDPQIQCPYSANVYLGVQRALSPTLMIESGFVGNRGVKYRLDRIFNWPDRVTDVRPNPALGQGSYYNAGQNTVYYAWQTDVRRRYARGAAFNLHYTWGKALSYTGGDTGAHMNGDTFDAIQDFFDVRRDRGPSSGDHTHQFAADSIYVLPSFANVRSRAARGIIGDWQISGIFSARSGIATNITQSGLITRADYVGGDPINRNYKRDGVYLNKAAFAMVPLGKGGNPIRPGTLGNQAIRGTGVWNVDFSLGKNFVIAERRKLEIRADMFNVLNYTPYTGFTNGINSANFGKITGHADARQIQLAARLAW